MHDDRDVFEARVRRWRLCPEWPLLLLWCLLLWPRSLSLSLSYDRDLSLSLLSPRRPPAAAAATVAVATARLGGVAVAMVAGLGLEVGEEGRGRVSPRRWTATVRAGTVWGFGDFSSSFTAGEQGLEAGEKPPIVDRAGVPSGFRPLSFSLASARYTFLRSTSFSSWSRLGWGEITASVYTDNTETAGLTL
ncbi:hypothetical protein NQZ68_039804 [Dissostichus eleginoides]|nr:hypothetical protein NQZ68_039804 [Dissostichus eleginoides]